MKRFRPLPAGAVLALTLLAAQAFPLEVPAGSSIDIRLKTKISTQTSKPKDPVEAVVIAPVLINGEFAIPAGAEVRGVVQKATQPGQTDERPVLLLSFTQIEIAGSKKKIETKVSAVDNARETVDGQGQINGILASETLTGELDSGLNKLANRYSELADVLSTVKNAVLKPVDTAITYDAGVEMELQFTKPLPLTAAGPGPAAQVGSIPHETALANLVAREPFQTMAEKPSKPSDITNLMLLGTEEVVRKAFTDAGWSLAAGLNTEAKFETFKAIAEARGYSEAPVSILLLDGKPPDLVFEKTNNTFARRHHLRVWRRPQTFLGSPVWLVTATHDTGIDFSEQDRTFIHRIDSQIDRERAKVVNDLIFSGHVTALALVDRPNIPQHAENATGDNLDTDGKLAVVQLK